MRMIEAAGLHKSFGETHALAGLDLDAEEGTILCVLGPNGAGKTTAVRILTTLSRPDSGTATVAGVDVLRHPEQARRRLGVAGQYASLDEMLTGRENLGMIGRLYRIDATTVAAARRRAARAASSSRMRPTARSRPTPAACAGASTSPPRWSPAPGALPRRADHRPRPEGPRRAVGRSSSSSSNGGTTVLLTTQYLEEADRLADDIVVIDHGRSIARGTALELKQQVGGERLEVVIDDPIYLADDADAHSRRGQRGERPRRRVEARQRPRRHPTTAS